MKAGRRTLPGKTDRHRSHQKSSAPEKRGALQETPPRDRFLSAVLDTIGALVVVLDRRGRIVYFNKACERMTGYGFLEVVGRPLWETLVPPAETEEVKAVFGELASGGVPNRHVNNWITSEGRLRLIEWSNTVLEDDGGSVEYVIGTGIDTTERRAAEETVRDSRRKLQILIETGGNPMGLYGREGVLIMMNKAGAANLGGEPTDFIGKSILELLPFSGEAYLKRIELAFDTGEEKEYEDEVEIPAGNRVFLSTYKPMADERGEIYAVQIVSVDISERKRHEEELRLSAARFRELFEKTPVAVLIEDFSAVKELLDDLEASGAEDLPAYLDSHPDVVADCARLVKIVDVNEAAVELYRARDKDELLAGGLGSIFTEASHPVFKARLLSLAAGARSFEREVFRKTLDGAVDSILLRSSLDEACSDTWSRLLVSVVDITGLKKADRELRESEQKYRTLLGTLNEDLTARGLELETYRKEVEALSYSVSHDLRAPLRSIDGFSLALLEDYQDKLDDKGRDYLNRVRAASENMAQLIDDILKLSRVTRADIHRQPTDVSRMAREISEELAACDDGRAGEFEIEPGMVARADAQLLRQALWNLMENAWKFTSGREVARIQVGTTLSEGERAFFVRDNGMGFDMTYSGKLFLPFQQLHNGIEFAGTGIGLATVQRVVRRHGGRVWGEGKPSGGATLYFTMEPAVSSGSAGGLEPESGPEGDDERDGS